MKRMNYMLASFIVIASLTACSDSGTANSTGDSATMKQGDSNNTSNNAQTDNTSNANTTPTNMTPLSKDDSTFAMKAAEGGMMEVESGNIALQNSENDRVKAFAQMMVNDHSKANTELMSLASSHGMTLPSALPADKQKHVDAMKAMKGKAFDKHYMDMMVNDHKKTVADFEKESNSGMAEDLKAWAGKTLPTLKMHTDSAAAISKMKM